MKAKPGDLLLIHGHRVGDTPRDGEILEVHGENGEPPYLVRWSADGHTAVYFPGSDASIRHRRRSEAPKP